MPVYEFIKPAAAVGWDWQSFLQKQAYDKSEAKNLAASQAVAAKQMEAQLAANFAAQQTTATAPTTTSPLGGVPAPATTPTSPVPTA